jgi:starch synthase
VKILFAASEAAPFAKTGGLADVAGSLPPALAALGHDVRVVLPRYRCVDRERFKLRSVASFSVPVGGWKERCEILGSRMDARVKAYFVQKDLYFDRPGLYGTAQSDYADNAERFLFFSRAALELCRALDFSPDIVHCNDWQTGFMPLYLDRLYRSDARFKRTRSVFTVHNLGYQGLFWHWDMKLTGLGWEEFTPEGVEFFGKVNFMKAGLVAADLITTVSKTYSREIQTAENGHGLEGVLAKRAKDLFGVVNGIDYRLWDPAHDRDLPRTFSATRLAGKAVCREELKRSSGLAPGDAPLIGMVTRLAAQKGLDIVAEALPAIMASGAQLVILGTGDATYQKLLTEASRRYPKRMRILLRYDEKLAKQIYAGCDMFLMPSHYEPCGLSQMIALRYGTVPIVRRTGGLADTVEDYHPRSGRGTGFVFDEYSSDALIRCLERAIAAYTNVDAWHRLMQAGMKQDFSWRNSAKEYESIYRKAMKKKQ